MPIVVDDDVDTDRYPITEPGPARDGLIADLRAAIERDGCAVASGFVRSRRIADLVAECDRVAPFGHRDTARTNPYSTTDRPELAASRPLRRFFDRSNAFVPADRLGADSILRAIDDWPAFAPFVEAVLGGIACHRYADPLADVIVNLADEGGGFPWHFDTNDDTLTLAIPNADEGGAFEFCPSLRTPTDENYAGVQSVLDGDRSPVHTLHLRPADLQIFTGRHSLHRVAPLSGPTVRYVGIFSDVEHPGMVGDPERARQLHGRVLPVHLERAGMRADALVD